MGGSASTSSSVWTTTTTISDAFNTTLNRVSNLSNVGNVSVDLRGSSGTDNLPSMSLFLPIAIVGIAGIVAVMIFRRP